MEHGSGVKYQIGTSGSNFVLYQTLVFEFGSICVEEEQVGILDFADGFHS